MSSINKINFFKVHLGFYELLHIKQFYLITDYFFIADTYEKYDIIFKELLLTILKSVLN